MNTKEIVDLLCVILQKRYPEYHYTMSNDIGSSWFYDLIDERKGDFNDQKCRYLAFLLSERVRTTMITTDLISGYKYDIERCISWQS